MTLGPFSFSLGLLSSFLAILAAIFIGKRIGRARGQDVESLMWVVIGVAALAARISYLAAYSDQYLAAPMAIIDIRDGGFHMQAGILAGIVTALLLGWWRRPARMSLLAGAAAGVAVLTLASLAPLMMPGRDQHLPVLTLERLEGGALGLHALNGGPVVVNLWATWCPPCRREMPVLRQAQLEHPEITFVFLNQGESQETIRRYLASQQIVLDNVVLSGGVSLPGALGSKGLPTTLFFDQNGNLTGRRVGELSGATLAQRLEALHRPHTKVP